MNKVFWTLIFILALAGYYIFFHESENEFKEGDLYNEIIQRGILKVGINPDSKPFAFYDNEGRLIGYDIDLANQIALYVIKNPKKVEFVPITPANRLIKASTGEVDLVISTVTITPQRREVVGFSIPYAVAGQAVLVKSNSAIKSISDLAGLNVGVIFGTTAEKNMKKLVPNANLRGFKNYNDAYVALKSGQISAITSDDTILKRFASDDKSVKLLVKRYSNEPYGIAFKKGQSSKQLKEIVDYAIKDLKRKNVMKRLEAKWNI